MSAPPARNARGAPRPEAAGAPPPGTAGPLREVGALPAADLAALFAALFAGPLTLKAVGALRRMAADGMLEEIGAALDRRPAAAAMASALLGAAAHAGAASDAAADAPCDAAADAAARALQHRHALLFDGVGGPRTVPLCESAHAGGAVRLGGPSVAAMRAMLRRLDMAPAADRHEPEDHLALELAALSAALRQDDGEAAAALLRRLSGWAPSLRRALDRADPGGFHAAAAALVEGFLAALAAAPPRRAAPPAPCLEEPS